MTPSQMFIAAAAAWGVQVGEDGRMVDRTGAPVKTRWELEPSADLRLLSPDAEVELAARALDALFRCLAEGRRP